MNRQKLTVLARKFDFVPKRTPQKRLFLCARIGVTWPGPGRQTVDTRSTKGGPWKLWLITLQTSYVEGRWHKNWAHMSPLHCFSVCARKRDFLGKTLRTPKFSKGNFFGAGTQAHVFQACNMIWQGFSEPQCFNKSDGSQDAPSGSPDVPNELNSFQNISDML